MTESRAGPDVRATETVAVTAGKRGKGTGVGKSSDGMAVRTRSREGKAFCFENDGADPSR